MAIRVGVRAPDFSLKDQNGQTQKLASLKDDFTVLYFYPKDDTPGCTIEALEFTAARLLFEKHGARVLGVSGGDEESKQKFCKKHKLSITLLADPKFSVAKKYEAFGEKQFMGRKFLGIFRKTFILDKSKRVIKVFEAVKAEGHAEEVLEFIKNARRAKVKTGVRSSVVAKKVSASSGKKSQRRSTRKR